MIRANLFLLATFTIFVSMKTPVDIWVELGARLSSFGQDAASREVIVRACQKNDWFEPEEIVDAVRSIREEFLSRDKIEHWLACYERPATLPSRTVLVVMAGNIPLVGFFDFIVCRYGWTSLSGKNVEQRCGVDEFRHRPTEKD